MQLEKFCNDAPAPVSRRHPGDRCRRHVRRRAAASGIGAALADVLSDTGMPVILTAFLVRRTAGRPGFPPPWPDHHRRLMAPTVAATHRPWSELDLTFIVIAIAGARPYSPTSNDSGFLAGQPAS